MKQPQKTIYIIHPGDGSTGGGELYTSKAEADAMAAELTEQEGAPWYVAAYDLRLAKAQEGGGT